MMFPVRTLLFCYIIAVHAGGDESKNETSVKNLTNIDNSNLPKIHIVVRTYSKAEVVQDDAKQQDVELGDSSSDLSVDINDQDEVIDGKAMEPDRSLSANPESANFNEPDNIESSDKAATKETSLLTQSFERISNMATLAWDYVTHTEKQTQRPGAKNDLSGLGSLNEVHGSSKTEPLNDEKGANDVYFEEDNLKGKEEVSQVFLENSLDQHDHAFPNDKNSLHKVNNGKINGDYKKLDSPIHKIKPKSKRNLRDEKVENSKLKSASFSHPRKNVKNSKVRKDPSQQKHSSGKNISSAYFQSDNRGNGTHDNRNGGSSETILVEEYEENTPLQADQPSSLWSLFGGSDTTDDHTTEHPDVGPEDTELDDDTGSASPVIGYEGDVLDVDRPLVNNRHNSLRPVAEADLSTSDISRLIDHYDTCDTCMVNNPNISQRCHFYTNQADEFDKWAKSYTDLLRYGCSSPGDVQRRERCCHSPLVITQTALHEINKVVKSISNVLSNQCQKCPVDCTWSDWQSWDHCPLTCDRPSTRNRTRTRISQKYGGRSCSGPDVDLDNCDYEQGTWQSWSTWSACSSTCGGTRHRSRTCTKPTTYSCFVPCDDSEESSYIEVEKCGNTTGCCEQGTWLSWSSWSACSSTCGGSKHRTRKCTQPTTYSCFVPCDDSRQSTFDVEQCESLAGCCHARQWSQWGAWTDCDTGEAGSRTLRQRRWRCCEADPNYIDQPMCPQPCPGSEFDVKDCCIPAFWSQWTSWSNCVGTESVVDLETGKPCGKGCSNRTRVCDEGTCPGGACYGDHIERSFCSLEPCCVPPVWSQWCPWSECSVTPGAAIRRRTRDCQTDPEKWRSPTCQAGGCYGQPDKYEVEDCRNCVQPSWGSWGDWSECDFNRVNPRRTQTRHCIKNLDPACRHLECSGEDEKDEPCMCPPPSWGSWGQWSGCDFNRANPRRTMTRHCSRSRLPACRHIDCVGDSVKEERCVCQPPYWESWSQWGPCDQNSNPPVRQRHRLCRQASNPQYCPQDNCVGDSVDRDRCCGRQEWSPWSEWSQCNTGSNPQMRTRVRHCQRPDPGCPNQSCIGRDRETSGCTPTPCDPGSWDIWSSWSDCDCLVTRSRSRTRSKHSQISGRPVCPPTSDTHLISCDRECPECQDTCIGRKDGEYPSCRRGCRHFVTCCNEVPSINECKGKQQYDSTCQKCTKIPSPTCPDGQYDIYRNRPEIRYKKPEECGN